MVGSHLRLRLWITTRVPALAKFSRWTIVRSARVASQESLPMIMTTVSVPVLPCRKVRNCLNWYVAQMERRSAEHDRTVLPFFGLVSLDGSTQQPHGWWAEAKSICGIKKQEGRPASG